MNHKNKRPRRSRAGCKMCKPHKASRAVAHRLRDKRQDAPPEEFTGVTYYGFGAGF